MMQVKVVAPFEIAGAGSQGEVELPENATVGQLLRRLHPPLYARVLPIVVNGLQAGRRQVLHPGDLVIFVMPYSGG